MSYKMHTREYTFFIKVLVLNMKILSLNTSLGRSDHWLLLPVTVWKASSSMSSPPELAELLY